MKVTILFPKDSKRPGKGFKEETYEVPPEVVREMFETYRETKNVNRSIDVVCEWVANEAARRWCRSMGRPKDENCISEYLDKQGERIVSQCEAVVRRWIYDVAECLKRCGRERKCLESCVKSL